MAIFGFCFFNITKNKNKYIITYKTYPKINNIYINMFDPGKQ